MSIFLSARSGIDNYSRSKWSKWQNGFCLSTIYQKTWLTDCCRYGFCGFKCSGRYLFTYAQQWFNKAWALKTFRDYAWDYYMRVWIFQTVNNVQEKRQKRMSDDDDNLLRVDLHVVSRGPKRFISFCQENHHTSVFEKSVR